MTEYDHQKPDDVIQAEWDALGAWERYEHLKRQLDAEKDEVTSNWSIFKKLTNDEFLAWSKKHRQAEDELFKPIKSRIDNRIAKERAANIARGDIVSMPPLSEKEQEKYRLADEKLRQSDWFQLSKQEQADWDRGVDDETQNYIKEAEKERKIRADAEMPYLMIIAILVFVVAPLFYFPDPGFVLGWVCISGLLGTLIWIYNRTT